MEDRWLQVETKIAFLEKNLEDLDEVVRSVSDQMDRLRRVVEILADKSLGDEGLDS